MSDEDLADLLASEIEPDPTWRAATAEFKLREHVALLAQEEAAKRAAEASERQALAAERAAQAAERQAEAAERTAASTARYTWFTLGVLAAAVVTAIATWLAVLK